MIDIVNKITKIKNDLMEYTSMRIRLYKFEILEKIAEERSNALAGLMLWLVVLFLLLFANLAAAMYMNEIYGSVYAGFAIVATFWAVMLVIALAFRKSIKNYFMHRYLNKNIPS